MSDTSEEDHLKFQIVLQRLLSAGLSVKKEKLVQSFKRFLPWSQNSEFQAFPTLVTKLTPKDYLHPLPDKINAIQRAATPKSTIELKALLELMNYYGKFIPNLATILHPL